MEHAKQYEFGDITWYPSKHTAVYRYDSRVPLNASGDGVYDFIGFQANSILISESVRAAGKNNDLSSTLLRSQIHHTRCVIFNYSMHAKNVDSKFRTRFPVSRWFLAFTQSVNRM